MSSQKFIGSPNSSLASMWLLNRTVGRPTTLGGRLRPPNHMLERGHRAASGALHVTLGGYSKPPEMDSATQKIPEMTYHMCLCAKNHLEAVFEAAFGRAF